MRKRMLWIIAGVVVKATCGTVGLNAKLAVRVKRCSAYARLVRDRQNTGELFAASLLDHIIQRCLACTADG
jgi:hypothetical protein